MIQFAGSWNDLSFNVVIDSLADASDGAHYI